MKAADVQAAACQPRPCMQHQAACRQRQLTNFGACTASVDQTLFGPAQEWQSKTLQVDSTLQIWHALATFLACTPIVYEQARVHLWLSRA